MVVIGFSVTPCKHSADPGRAAQEWIAPSCRRLSTESAGVCVFYGLRSASQRRRRAGALRRAVPALACSSFWTRTMRLLSVVIDPSMNRTPASTKWISPAATAGAFETHNGSHAHVRAARASAYVCVIISRASRGRTK